MEELTASISNPEESLIEKENNQSNKEEKILPQIDSKPVQVLNKKNYDNRF